MRLLALISQKPCNSALICPKSDGQESGSQLVVNRGVQGIGGGEPVCLLFYRLGVPSLRFIVLALALKGLQEVIL